MKAIAAGQGRDIVESSVSVIDLSAGTPTNDLLDIHADAVVRAFGPDVYVVNRLGQDNVIALDASDTSTPKIQFTTGNGTNPHDIVRVADDRA